MAGKAFNEKKLKKYEEIIKRELLESIEYIENINRDQSIGARESSGDLSS